MAALQGRNEKNIFSLKNCLYFEKCAIKFEKILHYFPRTACNWWATIQAILTFKTRPWLAKCDRQLEYRKTFCRVQKLKILGTFEYFTNEFCRRASGLFFASEIILQTFRVSRLRRGSLKQIKVTLSSIKVQHILTRNGVGCKELFALLCCACLMSDSKSASHAPLQHPKQPCSRFM